MIYCKFIPVIYFFICVGQVGWGIAWYINGYLVPELVLRRGNTYTFNVQGGDDPIDISNYHPFYITNSLSGGRLLNTQEQQAVSCSISIDSQLE